MLEFKSTGKLARNRYETRWCTIETSPEGEPMLVARKGGAGGAEDAGLTLRLRSLVSSRVNEITLEGYTSGGARATRVVRAQNTEEQKMWLNRLAAAMHLDEGEGEQGSAEDGRGSIAEPDVKPVMPPRTSPARKKGGAARRVDDESEPNIPAVSPPRPGKKPTRSGPSVRDEPNIRDGRRGRKSQAKPTRQAPEPVGQEQAPPTPIEGEDEGDAEDAGSAGGGTHASGETAGGAADGGGAAGGGAAVRGGVAVCGAALGAQLAAAMSAPGVAPARAAPSRPAGGRVAALHASLGAQLSAAMLAPRAASPSDAGEGAPAASVESGGDGAGGGEAGVPPSEEEIGAAVSAVLARPRRQARRRKRDGPREAGAGEDSLPSEASSHSHPSQSQPRGPLSFAAHGAHCIKFVHQRPAARHRRFFRALGSSGTLTWGSRMGQLVQAESTPYPEERDGFARLQREHALPAEECAKCFQLVLVERNLLLMAPTVEEKQLWVAGINALLSGLYF